jgi:hypothetical protein
MAFTFRYFNGITAAPAAAEITGAVRRIEDFDRVMQNNRWKIAARDQAMRRVDTIMKVQQFRYNRQLAEDQARINALKLIRDQQKEEFDMGLKLREANRLDATAASEIQNRAAEFDLSVGEFERSIFNDRLDLRKQETLRRDQARKELNLIKEAGGELAVFGPVPDGKAAIVGPDNKIYWIDNKHKASIEHARLMEEAKIQASLNLGTKITQEQQRKFDLVDQTTKNKATILGNLESQFTSLSARANRLLEARSKATDQAEDERAKELSTDLLTIAGQLQTNMELQQQLRFELNGTPFVTGEEPAEAPAPLPKTQSEQEIIDDLLGDL